MVGSRRTIALAALGLLAFALRVWAVPVLPDAEMQVWAMPWLQCVVGTAIVLAVGWLGWSLLPERPSVGWLAALAAAAYPPHVQIVAHGRPELWLALVLIVLLAVVAAPGWRATRRGAVVAGGLAGLLVLLEPPLVWLLPICTLAFWLAEGKPTWIGCFTPAAFGRLALMVGVATALSTAAVAYHGIVQPRASGSQAPAWEPAADVPKLELGNEIGSEGEIASVPLNRLQSFLLFDRSTLRTSSRLCLISMVAWLVLTLVGLSVSCNQWRELWPTYAVFAVMLVLQVVGLGSPTVRVALEPMTFIWASAAIAPLLVHFGLRPQIRIYRPGEQGRDPFAGEEMLQGPHFDMAAARRRAG